MRSRLPLLLVLLLVGFLNAQAQYGVERSYDRFKDESTLLVRLSLPPPPNATHTIWTLIASTKGESFTERPASVSAALLSRSGDWIYGAGDVEWRVILNGSDRLLLGTARRVHTAVKGADVTEGLGIDRIPLSSVEQIAKASKVEMRIGHSEFVLSDSQLKILREFLSRLPEK